MVKRNKIKVLYKKQIFYNNLTNRKNIYKKKKVKKMKVYIHKAIKVYKKRILL